MQYFSEPRKELCRFSYCFCTLQTALHIMNELLQKVMSAQNTAAGSQNTISLGVETLGKHTAALLAAVIMWLGWRD